MTRRGHALALHTAVFAALLAGCTGLKNEDDHGKDLDAAVPDDAGSSANLGGSAGKDDPGAAGMSGHAGKLIECLDFAIDHKLVDVVLVAYNFGSDPAFYQKLLGGFDWIAVQPDLPRVLDKAKAAGVGVVAMKTLMGARLNDMRRFEKPGGTFAQSAFRWVLSSSNVDGLIVSMTSRTQVDEYLGASGSKTVAAAEIALMASLDAET